MIISKPVISTFIALKCLIGTLLFTMPEEGFDHKNTASYAQSVDNNTQELLIQDDQFNSFLEAAKEKGLGILTLFEAAGLYFLWTMVKDTKTREEILEKVFDSWSKEEGRVRAFGKLFRFLGMPCLGLDKVDIREIKIHIEQGRQVIIIYDDNKGKIVFLKIKEVMETSFIDEDGTSYSTSEIGPKGLFDILVFLESDMMLKNLSHKLDPAQPLPSDQQDPAVDKD